VSNRDKFIKFLYKLYDYTMISNDYDAIPRDYGVDQKIYINEAHTLAHIYNNEGITISDIAQIENKTLSALSQKIKKLQNKGLITKERDPVDYKKFNLFTTDQGKIVCQNQLRMDKIFFDNILDKIDTWESMDFDSMSEVMDMISQVKLDEMTELKKAD